MTPRFVIACFWLWMAASWRTENAVSPGQGGAEDLHGERDRREADQSGNNNAHRATDANVNPLAALKHLRQLSLSCPDRDSITDLFGVSSKVTANHLQPITALPLERVSLFCGSQNPRLPDSILDPLTQIPTLQHVNVYESRFSPAAIERLREKLPKTCQLHVARPI